MSKSEAGPKHNSHSSQPDVEEGWRDFLGCLEQERSDSADGPSLAATAEPRRTLPTSSDAETEASPETGAASGDDSFFEDFIWE